jgi:hypothetical protein
MTLAAIDRLVHHATILESTPCCARSQTWFWTAADTRGTQGKGLIAAQRHLKKRHRKKILAKLNNRHDHTFATGRRFKL